MSDHEAQARFSRVANVLTLSRILFAALFLASFCDADFFPHLSPGGKFASSLIALSVFSLALVSDVIDGKIARAYRAESTFGQLMDPIADKVLVTAVLVSFVGHPDTGFVKAWQVVVITSREFLVTGMRLLAAARGEVLAAERLGKHKTGWQMGYIFTTVVWVVLRRWGALTPIPLVSQLALFIEEMLKVGIFAVVFMTILSGAHYLLRNTAVLKDPPQ